jgi:hypothetical protein
MPARRPQDWTAEKKYAVMIEVCSLSDDERGRSSQRTENGLRQANLMQWRQIRPTCCGTETYRPSRRGPGLPTRGKYVASESALYRLIRAANHMAHRQRAKPATSKKARAQVATGPNQVWCWGNTQCSAQFFVGPGGRRFSPLINVHALVGLGLSNWRTAVYGLTFAPCEDSTTKTTQFPGGLIARAHS